MSRKPKPISKAKLAERRGVHRSTVTRACEPGGALEAAVLARGRVDLSHPATQAWLAGEPETAAVAAPVELQSLADLRLRDIDDRYGSVQALADYVDLRKKIAETHRIELQNAETKGLLISTELVRTHVFGAIDGAFRRLLGDTSKTIAARAQVMTKAGESLEQIEIAVRDLVGATLAQLKTSSARGVRAVLSKPKATDRKETA